MKVIASNDWLKNLVVVKVILTKNVFLIKSMLNDAEVDFLNVSFLGDNRVLISFDSSEKLTTFLGMKKAFKDFFSDIEAWNRHVIASHRLVWINLLGIAFKLRNLEFLKFIGDDCGEFITVSKSTLNKQRFDVASIIVSTTLDFIPSNQHFNVNGELIKLYAKETSISVDMVDDDEEDSISHDDDVDDFGRDAINPESLQSGLDNENDLQFLDSPIQEDPDLSLAPDCRNAFVEFKESATLLAQEEQSHNGMQIISAR